MKLLSATLLLAATFATHAQTTTPAQLEQWREQSVHALFIDSPLPPLKPQSFGSFVAAPGVRVEHITFGTQYGMRVPAIVYAPAHPKGRVPALVVVNGHGGDKSSWYAVYTGLLYASAGAVVVTYDPIGEFERTPRAAPKSASMTSPSPASTILNASAAS